MTDETEEVLRKALELAFEFVVGGDKGTTIDRENRAITYVCHKGVDKDMLMQEGMLGDWFIKHGFNIDFEVRDVEYITKGTFDYHSLTNYRGHKAYLRNRTVMTITW